MPQGSGWFLMTIGVVLCVLEIFIPGFVIFPIGLGAISAGVLALFGGDTTWVLITWTVTSLVFWMMCRKIFKKMTPEDTKTGIEALVGKEAKVVEEINGDNGRVKVFGDEWQVINGRNEIIPVGKKVKVVGFEGNKLKVLAEK